MSADVLVLGHGIAGAVVAWTLARAGMAVRVADGGISPSASRVGAGLINPVTGRRLVPSWRVREALPVARRVYGEMAAAWGVPLWHEMRVRRLYADETERTTAHERWSRGEFAPYSVSIDDEGCWFAGAARVDVAALLTASEQHWRRLGAWQVENLTVAAALAQARYVVDCRGLAVAGDVWWRFLPWRTVAGELLEVECDRLVPDVVLNRRQWLVPVGARQAWVGATQAPGLAAAEVTAGARERLLAAAAGLTDAPLRVTGQRAGVRLALPDRRPGVGWHPREPRLGLCSGLGSKGALQAPWLAAGWADLIAGRQTLPDEVGLQRWQA